MKNRFNYFNVITICLVVILLSAKSTFAQDEKECERIAMEIYQGVNDRKAAHLIPHLSDNFSMAGYTGEIAFEVFKAMMVQLNDEVSDIKMVSNKKDELLSLVFKAKWGVSGYEQSTFVFNNNNQLVSLELLPTTVKEQ